MGKALNENLEKLDQTEYRVSRRTGMRILLASILVNFFLLGLLAAPLFRSHSPFPPFGPPGNFIDFLTRGLSPNDAAILHMAYKKNEPVLIAARSGMDAGMHEVTVALQKPVVDQVELQKALNDLAASHDKMLQTMDDLIKHAATDLTPEGRRIFSENGLHPPLPPGMGPSHGGDSKPFPPPPAD